jgi:hypothetical protein
VVEVEVLKVHQGSQGRLVEEVGSSWEVVGGSCVGAGAEEEGVVRVGGMQVGAEVTCVGVGVEEGWEVGGEVR